MIPFERAIAAFDAAHAEDPRRAPDGTPHAVRYHATLSRWVDELAPEASEALKLAARAQHLDRWRVPRETFPAGADGYKKWRSTLARKHAEDASRILGEAGVATETIHRVAELLMKKRLASDPEVALFEDAICLTFLELELEPFLGKSDPAKAPEIVRKTWKKMTAQGHAAAARVLGSLLPSTRALVRSAIDGL